MMMRITGIVIFVLFVQTSSLLAQFNAASYQLQGNLVQSDLLNPAFKPENDLVIGLPGISSVFFRIESPLSISDLLKRGANDSLSIDTTSLMRRLRDKNIVGSEADVQLFLVGVKIQEGFLSLGARLRADARLSFPGELVRWGLWGPADERAGNTIDLGGVFAKGIVFSEIYVGYAQEVNNQLTVGARVKMLNGLVGSRFSQEGFFHMSVDSISLSVKDSELMLSGTDIFDLGFNSTYLFNRNNGFGLDLGASFKASPYLDFSASVSDLGVIRWREFNTTYRSENVDYSFYGIDIVDKVVNNGDAMNQTNEVDSLLTRLEPQEVPAEDFSTALSSKVAVGVRYNILETHYFGGLIYTRFFNGRAVPSVAVNYHLKLKDIFHLITGLSVHNKRANNLMAGFVFKPGPFQLYFVTDRLNALFYPARTNELNFRTGMNLVIGKPDKMVR
ncbi:MAG: DUF5723 family protein [Cyclobacteriaceae bacterium]|nr:DUF5723 family protein [Cyclobacteriaceae bacterium]